MANALLCIPEMLRYVIATDAVMIAAASAALAIGACLVHRLLQGERV